jgi:hypothetical protein
VITDIANLFTANKEASALLIAIAGGGFALWRWTIDQRWRRVQYAYQLINEFMAKDNTKKALMMLDTTNYIELFPEKENPEEKLCRVNEHLIINALKTFDQQEAFDESEFAVRMIFDDFFTDLSMFQHHIDAKLIRLNDVRPYLEYWIKSINGHGTVKSIELARQINKFLDFFEYTAIKRLSRSMNFSLKLS